MKKTVLAALIGAALCSPWPALAESGYLKVGVGQSSYSTPLDTETERAMSLAYGAKLDATWGYEVGYIHSTNSRPKSPGTSSTSTSAMPTTYRSTSAPGRSA